MASYCATTLLDRVETGLNPVALMAVTTNRYVPAVSVSVLDLVAAPVTGASTTLITVAFPAVELICSPLTK